ncbi:MAG: DUF480 domain-containing protein [Acidimicrobiales bacterium]
MSLDKIFLYGTLIPGEERWAHLEPYVVDSLPDTARGLLYQTDFGYPAARFDCTNTIGATIHGVTVTIDADIADECMELLDEVEAAEVGLFHRVVVVTGSGETAWSYQYGTGLDRLEPIDSGSWVQHTTGEPPETAPPAGFLSDIEARVLGSLIEKALATPQNYPLSLNSLVAACNQKSSREPITDYDERAVMSTLTQCKERKLARFVHPTSGHGVTKYKQVLDEHLGLDRAQLALIGVLLLRGPQTARELRDRTERMHAFADVDEVASTLERLAEQGRVECLGRQPGQRDERWQQSLTAAGR